MRTLLKRLAVPTLFLAVGFGVGSAFGFRSGLEAFAIIDAAPRGAIAVGNLKTLSAGKSEGLKIHLESEVDKSLANFSLLSETWWYPLYQSGFILADPDSMEKYVRIAANYRETHPSLSHKEMFDKAPAGKEQYESEYKELALGIREHLGRVDKMVEKYADK